MAQVTIVENLKESSSKDMTVDGSSANKTYSYSPSSGTVALDGLVCIMDDPGAATLAKFGSITALTNGLLISVTVNGSTTNLTTIKDNADLATRFHDNHFGNSASDTLGGAVGFGDSYDIFQGILRFQTPITLTDSDSIQVVVRDNLSNILTLEIAVIMRQDI